MKSEKESFGGIPGLTKEDFLEQHKEVEERYRKACREFNKFEQIKRDMVAEEELRKAEDFKEIAIFAHDVFCGNNCDYWKREIVNGVHQWAEYSHHRRFLFDIKQACIENDCLTPLPYDLLEAIKKYPKQFSAIKAMIFNQGEQ